MTDHDVAVATPSNDTSQERPDRSLAEQLVDQARADGRNLVGPGGLLSDLTKQVLETGLEVEMEEHLGYPKHAVEGRNGANSRNGTRSKSVITEIGPIELDVPRDRDGSFEPATVRKNQRRLDGVDSMVISLTAKGLTTGEVEAHLAEVYSTNISRETISKITDRVLGELAEWQNRPLDRVYPVIFIDAIVVKIRDGQVANRPVYAAIGVTVDGQRDILGLWVGTGGEGAKYWLQVLTEIKNRGVEDACIVVCDGLKGLPESIGATWPLAIVQTCVLHLIRNTFRLASRADWDKMARDLRPVYTAVNEADAAARLDEFHTIWGNKYPAIRTLWRNAWGEFVPFLDYSPEIRRVIYSTNAIWVFYWLNRDGGWLRYGPSWRSALTLNAIGGQRPLISSCRAARRDGGAGEHGLKGAWELNPDLPVPRPRCHNRRPRIGGTTWTSRGELLESTRTNTTSPQR